MFRKHILGIKQIEEMFKKMNINIKNKKIYMKKIIENKKLKKNGWAPTLSRALLFCEESRLRHHQRRSKPQGFPLAISKPPFKKYIEIKQKI